MKNRAQWLMVALAMTGIAGAVVAQTTASTSDSTASSATSGTRHWRHHGGGGMMGGRGMLRAFHQLNLTAEQQASVKGILATAHTQAKARHQTASAPNFAALSNPGDPNHAAALQDLQARMSQHIQAQDQIQQQLYGVLTQAQKTQLASILAARQAKMAQHSAS
jgi:periplasmic protein CpxP/Spy